MRVLLLRFDAPLLAFGGTVVDARNVTDELPGRSMVTGLLANALGIDRRETERLARLQSRLVLAARRDREGARVLDFQTVDLGQAFLAEGWTTDGRVEGREGGSAGSGTHIRHRHYLADAVVTVALTLTPEDEAPTLDDLWRALDAPARPLFLGRKCCLPSEPIALRVVDGESLVHALASAPPSPRAQRPRMLARVPLGSPPHPAFVGGERATTDERGWANQIHVGREILLEGFLTVERGAEAST
jgi:CRISPR system Cascade subunit CasD